jgi:DNA-binding NarL/FixJ family response regulator
MDNQYKIILADDHAVLRAGLKMVIESKEDLHVVGEASDGVELLELMGRQPCDMVILDLGMPNLNGLDALTEVKAKFPKTKVVILTTHKQRSFLKKALSKGAIGYVLKEDAHVKLLAAIQDGRKGKKFISDEMLTYMIDDYAPDTTSGVTAELLSSREKEILHLTANGLTSREIGERLDISPRTVEAHRANIKEKLNLANTSELIKYAMDHGLS